MSNSTLVFVDGENLSLRYKEMIKAGYTPSPDNIVIDECFVWNQRILQDHYWNMKRISYYTSTVGDDEKVQSIRRQIAETTFQVTTGAVTQTVVNSYTGQIIPYVRKKNRKSNKESICDISIAVDVMRACYRDHAQTIWLFSGDGDFIQLYHEIVHSGKTAYASALSSGMCQEIPLVVDEFLPLDKYFFTDFGEIQLNPQKPNP